ncbi:MAG: hypothetical protein ACYSTL_01105, partial [Planctomycetota bacterium]
MNTIANSLASILIPTANTPPARHNFPSPNQHQHQPDAQSEPFEINPYAANENTHNRPPEQKPQRDDYKKNSGTELDLKPAHQGRTTTQAKPSGKKTARGNGTRSNTTKPNTVKGETTETSNNPAQTPFAAIVGKKLIDTAWSNNPQDTGESKANPADTNANLGALLGANRIGRSEILSLNKGLQPARTSIKPQATTQAQVVTAAKGQTVTQEEQVKTEGQI